MIEMIEMAKVSLWHAILVFIRYPHEFHRNTENVNTEVISLLYGT